MAFTSNQTCIGKSVCCGEHDLWICSVEQHKVGVNHKTCICREGKDLCWAAGFATDRSLELVKTVLYTDVACVVLFLTLMQIIWLPGLLIYMVYSVECQGSWPRKIILKICISFCLPFIVYLFQPPFFFCPQVKFN